LKEEPSKSLAPTSSDKTGTTKQYQFGLRYCYGCKKSRSAGQFKEHNVCKICQLREVKV
jgi:rRNA maturation endonuclease Nob1